MTEKDLLRKKKEIDEAKETISELKGEEKTLIRQLKTDYNCNNLEEAKTKLTEMNDLEEALERKIKVKSEKLEKEFFEEEE